MDRLPYLSCQLMMFAVLFYDPVSAFDERVSADLVTPIMVDARPSPGKRVRQVSVEYEGTAVYHSVYLPENWIAGKAYPVIVEYTGNKFPACGSTGEVKDANLGFGLSAGHDFIWITMPYIAKGKQANAVTWWGDRSATIEYCKRNLPRVCREFGGDKERVFLCGFSRGAIAIGYIGLADDEIASLWAGFIAHDHFDGQRTWNYPNSDRQSALGRLRRLNGRPVLVCGSGNEFLREHPSLAKFTFLEVPVARIFDIPDGDVIHPHTDLWLHRDSEYQQRARTWLRTQAGIREPTPDRG